MSEPKLKCLVEGYEDTYFEIGQVWETRNGEKIRLKGFTGNAAYPLLFDRGNDRYNEFTLKGNLFEDFEYELDLVKLILPKFPIKSTPSKPPKTLSEYLKENKAYENFVENTVERALQYSLKDLNKISQFRNISDFFAIEQTQEGIDYWCDLQSNQPKNLIYDMYEIIFAEVDKRLNKQKSATKFITSEEFDQMLQQKAPKKYMVFIEGRSNPKKIHDSYDSAEKEAKRLSAKEIGLKVFVVEIVKEFKSKVVVEETK